MSEANIALVIAQIQQMQLFVNDAKNLISMQNGTGVMLMTQTGQLPVPADVLAGMVTDVTASNKTAWTNIQTAIAGIQYT